MKKRIVLVGFALCLSIVIYSQQNSQVKILFDCSHAETSGNGDWCIDSDLHNLEWNPGAHSGSGSQYYHANPQQLPNPSQTNITNSTTETYWEGALSSWAIDCVKKGFWVETLPSITGHITYGDSGNPQDLSNYDIFIVDEPNILFTTTEKIALINFVSNGGSLFAISDHTNSDRNNDGHDSPEIWNDFFNNNSIDNSGIGISFALENFSGTFSNVSSLPLDSITSGSFGGVSEVQWSNGTCINIYPNQNPTVKSHIWKTGINHASDTASLCVTTAYGCGKIAAIGDSSPPDDGTGNPSVTLYNGYTGDANGNHRPWLMNIVLWLATKNCSNITTDVKKNASTNFTIYPSPFVDGFFIGGITKENIVDITIINQLGNQVKIDNNSIIENNFVPLTNLKNGIYIIQLKTKDTLYTKKIIKQD